jgi:hypothetical protein
LGVLCSVHNDSNATLAAFLITGFSVPHCVPVSRKTSCKKPIAQYILRISSPTSLACWISVMNRWQTVTYCILSIVLRIVHIVSSKAAALAGLLYLNILHTYYYQPIIQPVTAACKHYRIIQYLSFHSPHSRSY